MGCLLVNPVWNYYEVNQKIASGGKFCGRKVAEGATVCCSRYGFDLLFDVGHLADSDCATSTNGLPRLEVCGAAAVYSA